MATQVVKRQMRDYLVDRLAAGGTPVSPQAVQFDTSGTLYSVGEDGFVLALYDTFGGERFTRLIHEVVRKRPRRAVVVLKEGTTYFRSAAEDVHFKRDDRSLKHYSVDDVNRMILTRPEEQAVLKSSKTIQYYQPASSRLSEGLATIGFEPVAYDYTHLPADWFRPAEKDSTRLFLNTPLSLLDGPLCLGARALIPASSGRGA